MVQSNIIIIVFDRRIRRILHLYLYFLKTFRCGWNVNVLKLEMIFSSHVSMAISIILKKNYCKYFSVFWNNRLWHSPSVSFYSIFLKMLSGNWSTMLLTVCVPDRKSIMILLDEHEKVFRGTSILREPFQLQNYLNFLNFKIVWNYLKIFQNQNFITLEFLKFPNFTI